MDRNSNLLCLSVYGENGLGKTPFLVYVMLCNMFFPCLELWEKLDTVTSLIICLFYCNWHVLFNHWNLIVKRAAMSFMDMDGSSLLIMSQDSRCFSLLGVTLFSVSTFYTRKQQNISVFPKFSVFHFYLNKL